MEDRSEELVSNFQNIFKDPDFDIPGTTNLEKLNNLYSAIMDLNKGSKNQIYKILIDK